MPTNSILGLFTTFFLHIFKYKQKRISTSALLTNSMYFSFFILKTRFSGLSTIDDVGTIKFGFAATQKITWKNKYDRRKTARSD